MFGTLPTNKKNVTLPTNKRYIKLPANLSNEKLNKAKAVLVESLYTGATKKMGKILMGCCPFHQEKTPSFAIYTETNTWNCFAGCGGGDSVDFYMRLHSCDFKKALEELTK